MSSSLYNSMNNGNNSVTVTSAPNTYFSASTTSNRHQQDLLKNAMLAANSSSSCSHSNNNRKDSLLQHMATSFMANASAPQAQIPSFPMERRQSLGAVSAIAQATSIARSTGAALSDASSLNAAANLSTASASALTSSMLSGLNGNNNTNNSNELDLFEPVPLNNAAAASLLYDNKAGQPDNALARMLSNALDEITSGFDSDPISDYNSLYNMDPFPAQQQQQPQQDLLSQNAFLQATAMNSNKRSMPTSASPSNKRPRTSSSEESKAPRFRPYQEKQWVEQFDELLKFKAERGHCLVPHTFEENPTLSRWVKRQRYQYKLKQEGKQSTMTDARIVQLEQVGFVWDSHAAAWQERLQELALYKEEYGDCNVPSNFPKNPQLATWVKCQRRQCKLFWCGKSSNMTLDRFASLNQLGFTWELRNGSISRNMMQGGM